MKKYLLVIVALVFSLVTGANAQEVFRNEELSISVLEEGVWVVETTDMTTMYIVEGADRAVLIDTGTKCADLDKIVERITQKPLTVVATHAHSDHVGNIKYFDQIYLHPADTVVKRPPMVEFRGVVNYMEQGDVFDLGGRQLEVYLMPGHTPGSVVLVDKQNGMAFTGDAFGSGQVWLQLRPLAPMDLYIESCDRMMRVMEQFDIGKLYCGHYPHLKKALGMPYMDDMVELARRIKAGDYGDAVDFGKERREDYDPKLATYRSAQIVFDAKWVE